MNLFFYPDDPEILETWNWNSSYIHVFPNCRIEKKIRLFFWRSYRSTILSRDLLTFWQKSFKKFRSLWGQWSFLKNCFWDLLTFSSAINRNRRSRSAFIMLWWWSTEFFYPDLSHERWLNQKVFPHCSNLQKNHGPKHGLRTPKEEIVFTARPKIHSHS